MNDIKSRPRRRYRSTSGRAPRTAQAAHTEEGGNGGGGAPVKSAVAESPLAISEEVAVLAPVAPVAEGPPVKHLSPLGAVLAQLAAGGATVRPLGTRQRGRGHLPKLWRRGRRCEHRELLLLDF